MVFCRKVNDGRSPSGSIGLGMCNTESVDGISTCDETVVDIVGGIGGGTLSAVNG